MTGTYRQFDHTGDIGIDVVAPSEAELYAACAAGMFDILVERRASGPGSGTTLDVTAPDRERLLVNWLKELLYLHEVGRRVFSAFDVSVSRSAEGYSLKCVATGEPLEAAGHRVRREIKAITHHQLAVGAGADGLWRARIVFDI